MIVGNSAQMKTGPAIDIAGFFVWLCLKNDRVQCRRFS
jgi:hypothetical protein